MRLAITPLLSIVLVSGPSCERRDDLDGRRRAIPGLTRATHTGAVGAEGDKEPMFDFVDNRAAALVYGDDALTVSGRGIGLALLSRGGLAAQWRLGGGAQPSARVEGQVARFFFPFDRDPGGIAAAGDTIPVALRFHSGARNQLASVFLNDTKVGDIAMADVGAADYAIHIPTELFVRGENDLRLFFRFAPFSDGMRSAGSLERVAIGAESVPTGPPIRSIPVEHAGVRHQALSCATRSRISYYTELSSSRPQLNLQLAGSSAAAVAITSGSSRSREIYRGTATSQWQPVSVDLSPFAGELVRIDFLSEGPVDWGIPQIVADRRDSHSSASSAATAHIVLWLVSGLRADALGDGSSMPALRQLATKGTGFAAIARNPTASNGAIEILTGQRAELSSIAFNTKTLAELFRESGFKTALYANAPSVVGDSKGFERVVRAASLDAAGLWARARADLEANADTRTLTVLWVNEAALPWTPDTAQIKPEWRSYAGRVKPSQTKWLSMQLRAGGPSLEDRDRNYLRALYAGELAVVDSALATMVADVDGLGLTSTTGIIVVGDRGQELFEGTGFGDPTGLNGTGERVALVVSAPSRPAAERLASERLVVTADAFATALDLAQIGSRTESDGETVLSAPSGLRAVLLRVPGRARGVAIPAHRFIEPSRGAPRLFVDKDGETRAFEPSADLTTSRALIGWMSLLAAKPTWDGRRWGRVTNLRPAFSSENGGF